MSYYDDPTVALSVTRSLLGLGDLNIHDHANYITSTPTLGAAQTWRRVQVKSNWVEGSTTTSRVRDLVQDQLTVICLGAGQNALQTNIAALVAAVTQDSFNLTVTLTDGDGTATWEYACESCDYQMSWDRERILGRNVPITFTLLRQPVPISGPI